MGLPSPFSYWPEKLSKISSDRRTYVFLITVHDNFFFTKLIFGVTVGWVVVKRCKFVLIVVSNDLNTVKQCLTTFFFVEKLCFIGKISIRRSRKKQKTIEEVEMLKMSMTNSLF